MPLSPLPDPPAMTQRLTAARMCLERARLLLTPRRDPSAVKLLHQASAAIAAIALLEAESAAEDPRGELLPTAYALLERVRVYALENGLLFMAVCTPSPEYRHDTQRISTKEIEAHLSRMKHGATEPPADLMPLIVEAAAGPREDPFADDRFPTIPAPAPLPTLTELGDEPTTEVEPR